MTRFLYREKSGEKPSHLAEALVFKIHESQAEGLACPSPYKDQ